MLKDTRDLMEQARRHADEVTELIVVGKRVPRDMTETLRNDVRRLIRALEMEST